MNGVVPTDRPALSASAAATEAGDRLALVTEERRWTWVELAAAVEREGARLADAGAFETGPTPRVAFDAPPAADSVIRLLALIEAGACAVPLDPRLPPAARAERLHLLAPLFDLDGGSVIDGPGDLPWSGRPGAAEVDASPLAVLFTSGTTGAPRAVELSRSAFRASAAASAARLGWEPEDRWLCCLPLAHVGGLSIVTRCLRARRPIVLAGGFDAARVLDLLDRESVTLASFVPTMLHRLFEVDGGRPSPAALRVALVGGAPASETLWRGVDARRFPALATYGMTETCSQVATARPEAPRRLVPLEGARLRVVEGAIEVAGPMLCTRVGEDAAATPGASGRAATWTQDGWFRTGDVGEWREGSLEVLGRADETIVTGGENVAPAEVEAVLAAHPAIRRAVVFPVDDAVWGEVVAAALEPRPGRERPSGPDLASWLDERLASFQRPRRVAWLAALPETPAGKPDRAAVRALPPEDLETLRGENR